MGIEKELNQTKPFRSEFQKATINLIYTHNWLSLKMKNFFKPHGITMQQYNVLRILKGANKPLSTSCIRKRMIEKMADTSRLVERLSAKGWVERVANTEDKRLVDITITKEGLEYVLQLEGLDRYVESIYENLTAEEAAKLNIILNKLRNTEA
jgi:DNA-binding MarR family transcriptional regulator